ncbi:MAG TPA: peptidylprolyl isomerase [Bacteroidales bacterium]|nr:peptidylprolyl isomerase [Bacteroidales bacterium]HPR56838.1 peptidylprolyl isomerase [Bacteroidales bacterium]HRW96189.1 peptidylprolyl isomerase [Bacteroidales bacterium]
MSNQPAIGQESSGVVIDEVVAVVGKEYILLSDIEQQYLQMRMQESVQESEEYTKCLILENLLFEKLLLHQAELDSVVITQDQVNAELDRRMRYFISQFGSQEKLEQFYNKTVTEFKSDLSEVIKKQMMVENVQQTITEHVDVSPAEVRKYFREIPHDSIPLISSVVELAEIVKKPVISPEEKHQVRERLKKYRERVINGESFEALAVLYSEDPGSARQGGDIGLRGRGELYPEFETIAFQLDPGEVSDIVETEAGFHIIQGIERRGDFVRVRHILLKPKVSPEELDKARVFLDSIAELIRTDSLKFDDAVVKFSTDPSRNNNGIMINPNTGGSQWSLDELDPKMFFVIDKLEVGQISTPVVMEDEDGSEAYRLILLKNRTQPHRANIEDDYDQIQMWALQQKKTETVKKWIKNNSHKAYIRIDENYRSCNFENTWF